jgi:Ras-related protein Rab-21
MFSMDSKGINLPSNEAKTATAEKFSPLLKNVLEAKVVLLGDTGVGKTSIALRFVDNTFNPRIGISVGASFLMKTIEIDGTRIKLRLWDTAGQERFHSLVSLHHQAHNAPIYYRGATTAILCYDLTSKNSFAKIKRWVQELQENVDYEMSTEYSCLSPHI